ncbi:hypothetical protein [Pedobacter westerhofensis]|nr:hypothetical protein [Pedobacter westerhofensis]
MNNWINFLPALIKGINIDRNEFQSIDLTRPGQHSLILTDPS